MTRTLTPAERFYTAGFLIAVLLPLSGCQKAVERGATLSAHTVRPLEVQMMKDSDIKRLKRDSAQLARDHTLTLELGEASLTAAYHRLVDGCNQPAIHCTLLRAELTAGEQLSATLRMRLSPSDLPKLQQSASALGTVVYQSSRAEDLTDDIADTEARLAMTRDYRQKLLALQANARNNVESAVKIASELARVQQELEQLAGVQEGQHLRVETELLEINLQTPYANTQPHPIAKALNNFRADVSAGLAQVITGVAYIGPWLLILIPALLGVRLLWRGRRRTPSLAQ